MFNAPIPSWVGMAQLLFGLTLGIQYQKGRKK
jgi:hypothetical protein